MKEQLKMIEKQTRLMAEMLSKATETEEIKNLQEVLKSLDFCHFYTLKAIKIIDELIATEAK